jgi:hypothetical protein
MSLQQLAKPDRRALGPPKFQLSCGKFQRCLEASPCVMIPPGNVLDAEEVVVLAAVA